MPTVLRVSTLGPARAHAHGRREPLSAARREVLDVLLDSESGLTSAEVAEALRVHVNTAREHLDLLIDSGDAVRASLPAVGRGRPPLVYRAVSKTREVGPEFQPLAELLVEHFLRT